MADIDTIKKIKYISHEIKNQLSICGLYSEIIEKYCDKNNIKEPALIKSAKCIKHAAEMAANSLLELKALDNTSLEVYDTASLVSEAVELSYVYILNKNIKFVTNQEYNAKILVDKNKFIAAIINIIKNACEAFDVDVKNGNIELSVYKKGEFIKISLSNNAKPIENIDMIFKEKFTTKMQGHGLGLYICKKNIEEMSGKLELVKSDKISTVFEITMKSL